MTPSRQAVVVAFLIGCIAGVLGGGLMRHRRRGPDTQRLLDHLTRRLSLDDKQREGVKQALEQGRSDMEALHRDTFERMEKIRADVRARIEPLLDPRQKAEFQALKARWDKKRAQHGP